VRPSPPPFSLPDPMRRAGGGPPRHPPTPLQHPGGTSSPPPALLAFAVLEEARPAPAGQSPFGLSGVRRGSTFMIVNFPPVASASFFSQSFAMTRSGFGCPPSGYGTGSKPKV
jgi:hypothetical protein